MARKKLLIAAVIVGLFAMFLLYLYGQQVKEETREFTDPELRTEVVVAARNIEAGTPLSEDLIKTKSVPRQFLPPSPLLAHDIDIYLGQPVAQNIETDAMILTEDFAVTGEVSRTLSGRIPEGERAMTIPVDAVSGVAGLLRPGDRVDLLGTFPVGQEDELIPEASGGESVGYVTMSLLQNVTLLAVGQEISDIPSGQQRQRSGGYSNVTLSLTPDEAELMVIAQTRGQLQLLLRHRDDLDTVPVTRRTLRDVLEELDVINRERVERVASPPAPRARPDCDEGERYDSARGRCMPYIERYD